MAGIAWDGSVTNRPGARFGPAAIRRASQMLCDGEHPYFDVSPVGHLCDAGDLALPNSSLEAMRAALAPRAEELLAGHHMAWLGGDHSITLPLLRAIRPPAFPEKQRSWQRYRERFVNSSRIGGGLSFWQRHAATLQRAQHNAMLSEFDFIGQRLASQGEGWAYAERAMVVLNFMIGVTVGHILRSDAEYALPLQTFNRTSN